LGLQFTAAAAAKLGYQSALLYIKGTVLGDNPLVEALSTQGVAFVFLA
jgi:hypothetical protein